MPKTEKWLFLSSKSLSSLLRDSFFSFFWKKKFKNRKKIGEFFKKGQKLKNGYFLGSKMTKILKFALVRTFFFFFFEKKNSKIVKIICIFWKRVKNWKMAIFWPKIDQKSLVMTKKKCFWYINVSWSFWISVLTG